MNLRVNKKVVSTVISTAIFVGSLVGTVAYYNYESKSQVCEIDMNNKNIFVDEQGNFCCYFDVGEHVISISRNDAYYHSVTAPEGYTIKEVKLNSWKDNNKITYVNTVPVLVIGTKAKDGHLEFKDFGVASLEQNNEYKKTK